MKIYKNENIYIEKEESEIPWLKIFTLQKYKELSQCDNDTRNMLFKSMISIEKALLEFYKPEKINIAMFGNYVPHVHIHVMARFKEDSFFPEPMWGKKQRQSKLELPDFQEFLTFLKPSLAQL